MARVVGGVVVALIFVRLGLSYGFIRAVLGIGMFVAILLLGWSYWRNVRLAPPEPEIADVSDYGLRYVCTMCGLELKVEVAARDKAPRHCMEEMVLVRTGGRPPLRPL